MFSTALWTRNVHTFALFVVGRAEAPLLPAAMAGSLEQKAGCTRGRHGNLHFSLHM